MVLKTILLHSKNINLKMISDFSITTLAGGFQLSKILKGHSYGCCRLMNSEERNFSVLFFRPNTLQMETTSAETHFNLSPDIASRTTYWSIGRLLEDERHVVCLLEPTYQTFCFQRHSLDGENHLKISKRLHSQEEKHITLWLQVENSTLKIYDDAFLKSFSHSANGLWPFLTPH